MRFITSNAKELTRHYECIATLLDTDVDCDLSILEREIVFEVYQNGAILVGVDSVTGCSVHIRFNSNQTVNFTIR